MSTVADAFGDAARDARAAWHGEQTALAVLVALAAALPWFGPDWVHIDVLAAWLYLALSATGLALTAGLAGLPSLAQGAFMSVGSFATALLAARAGWSASATIPVAVGVALVLALACGVVLVRLPPLYLAVSTWLVAWLVLLVATEFPGVAGGSQGYTVPSDLSATGHYELALALTVLAVAGLSVLRRARIGVSLRAIRDRPAAAHALGVRSGRLLLGAFVASAAVGGLAGSLAVQLAGVSDPNAFGPFTSFKLLVAILLGGASYASAGVVGVAVLGAIALLGHAWAGLQNGAPPQLQPMLASTILLAILALGGDGVIPFVLRFRPGRERRGLPSPASAATPARPAAAVLTARGVWKSYGGVHALAGFDLDVAPGETVALVGANGSGKTTALRALAGALPVDKGEITLDRRPLSGLEPAVLAEAGVVRTLQQTSTFSTLTALESALVGAGLHARSSGALRTIASTPRARAESRALRAAAFDALSFVGLAEHAWRPAALLDGFQQRLLMLAAALATRPRVLMLDEPSAGAAAPERAGLVEILRELRVQGISLLVVEHDLPLVRAVADRVVVMADGKAAT
ncbi:MAG TPA: ATP-binding cassette domain-containing protein [Gaiellaceae bacterium]|nr:ATP-binding cassette domain-containing protein [Gaiellaceae bacterium]